MKLICGSLEAVLNEFSDRFDFREPVSGSLIFGSGWYGSVMKIEVPSAGLECVFGRTSNLALFGFRSPFDLSCGRLDICGSSGFLSM